MRAIITFFNTTTLKKPKKSTTVFGGGMATTAEAFSEMHRDRLPPPHITAKSIVLLSKDPAATLPSTFSATDLLDLLESTATASRSSSSTAAAASTAVSATSYISSLLSLLSRSPSYSSLPSLVSSSLLSFLHLLRSRRLPRAGDVAAVLHLFVPLLASLDASQLPALLDVVVSDLSAIVDPDDALPFDLLPPLLRLAGSNCQITAPVIEKLLEAEWSKPLLLKLVSLLTELSATAVRARVPEFLDKVFNVMKSVDIQDLPSLVYQLLLLASKGGNRRLVIRGILGFFGGSLKGPPSTVRQVEGTILMHVNFAVKQDPSLGQEVLSVVRADLRVLNHFAIVVLLSVARVRRFSESAIGVLKTVVTTSHRDYKISRDCKWLPENIKEDCLETAKHIEKAFIKAVNESGCGREHVVPSIVQFGFILLEYADGEATSDGSAAFMSIEELSLQMLKTLFEIHDMARNEIVEQCKFRILSTKPHKSMSIIKLLGNLIQSYTYPMLEHIAHLKELLEYFTYMPEKIAVALVDTILPLARFNHDLQDYIVLVVRKAMFKREDAVRIAATEVIISLISMENKSKINGFLYSSSQASSSQQAEIPNQVGVGLFQELSGLLRRCLSQQARVKQILYQGFVKLVLLDPLVASAIFDFLWPHFNNFYKEDTDSLLQVAACYKLESGKVFVLEPLDCLLSCVSWILLLQPHSKPGNQSEHSWPCFGFSISQDSEVGKSTSRESFSNTLTKLRTHFTKMQFKRSDVQDESQNAGGAPSQGEKTICHGQILLCVVEVLANIVASELEKAEEEGKAMLQKEIMDLAESYYFLEKDLSMNKQKIGAKRGSLREFTEKVNIEPKDYRQISQAGTLFATSSVYQLLVTAVRVYDSGYPVNNNCYQKSSQSSISLVDPCFNLTSFVIKVCLHHLKSVARMRSGDSGDPLGMLLYGDVTQLAKPLLELIWLLKSFMEQETEPKRKEAKGKGSTETKGDQLLLLLLCLNELLKMNLCGSNFAKLINAMLSMSASEMDLEIKRNPVEGIDQEHFLEDDVRSLHLLLEKRLKPVLSSLLSLSLFRESEILAELILFAGKKLPAELRNNHGNWSLTMCKTSKLENTVAARSVISLAIHLVSAPVDLIVARDMAFELLKVMGSEEKDAEEKSETFPIINKSTKDAVAKLLLQVAESCVGEIEWTISKLKAISLCNREHLSLLTNWPAERLLVVELEEVLYSRSEALVHLLSSFAEMNLKDLQAEQLVKVCAKFYKLLASMTKLRIAPKGFKQTLPEHKFKKLAEATCTKLTSPLYNFVALVQRNQQENAPSRGIISKIKRENKCVPDLIFQIEDYEKYLIQLSKLTKVNLLRHAKRSTTRDFKILELKKVPTEVPEDAPSEAGSADKSGGESEGPGEETLDVASPEPSGDGTGCQISEDDQEDQEVVIKKKRTKTTKVVQDSEDDSCG